MPTARDANRAALMRLPPELALLAAVVQQALHDEHALAWWGDVLGVGETLGEQVQAILRDG